MREQDEFMTVAEVASTLKLNQQTDRNWIIEAELTALHIGRRVRIRGAELFGTLTPKPELLDLQLPNHGPRRW